MKLSIQALLLSISLLVSACTPVAPAPDASAPATTPTPSVDSDSTAASDPLANTSWQLVVFSTVDSETPVVAGSTITLQFSADSQAGGSGGCNTYRGSYQVEGSTIAFGEIISTLRACLDNSITEQEQRYLQALPAVDQFALTDGQLTLTSTSTGDGLTFAIPLAGTLPPNSAAEPDSPLATPADTVNSEWTRQQFGGAWDIAYPADWTVNDAGANEGAIQLEGPYGDHRYAVTLSYPIGISAPTLAAWVDEQLSPLSPEARAVVEVSEISAAQALAQKVLNLPTADGVGLTYHVYIWRTEGKNQRLITISQTDDLPFDGAAMATFLDQFIAEIGI